MSKKYEAVKAKNNLDLAKQLTETAQGKREFKVIGIFPLGAGNYTAFVEYSE